MRRLPVLLLSLGLLAAATAAAAAPPGFTPYLVKDVNPTLSPGSSNPGTFVTLGGVALFQVSKRGHRELWRSDGTASGTYRLTEIGYTNVLAVTGDRCFFRYQSADLRWHLWVTDGTPPGTFSLGETSGYEEPGMAAWVPRQRLFYFASEVPGEGHGTELWRSDGTPGGTYEVLDLAPGPGSSRPAYLTSFQGRLYFTADNSLWRSDGTAGGTVQVAAGVSPASLQAVGPRLVFVGADAQGIELWASDGTAAGTRRIADLAPGPASAYYQSFQVVGRRLFFTATASAAKGEELYVTDGTAQGTQRLTWFSDPHALDQLPMTAFGDRLLFAAGDPEHGVELWSSDGTPRGTRRVLDACVGDCPSYPNFLLQNGGRLYYRATDGLHGFELWVTDGTARGTRMVRDLCTGACGSWPWALGAAGDRVFFVTWADVGGAVTLWSTDGTDAGTVALADLGDLSGAGAAVGGRLLFSGQDPEHGRELWSSDGTPEGTGLLADIADEDVGGSNPHGLMALGGSALFFANDGGGSALWRSDGTEAGTTALKRDLSGRNRWTASPTRVYFEANASQGSAELWTSDGTEAGTFRVTPDGVRSQGELSAPVTKLGYRVFFSAWSDGFGAEPWVTDGTREGTRRVADLNPGPAHSYPRDFTVFSGRAWFVARFRLWKSDGTARGTVAVGPELREIHPVATYGGRLWFTGFNAAGRMELWGTDGTAAQTVRVAERATIGSPVVHAGRLWFLAEASELWSTDGTAAGTRKLDLPQVDVPPWYAGPFRALLSDGARLYLADVTEGLWVSDGTAAGTRRISDQGPGPSWTAFAGRLAYLSNLGDLYTSDGTAAGTRPVRPEGGPGYGRLLRFGDRLVAITQDGELWRSDGTAAGTARLHDLAPADYDPWQAVKAGPFLFFPGWDEETGWELWAMRE